MSTANRFGARLGVLALVLASLPAMAIEPFKADYRANYMGVQADGSMSLEQRPNGQWSYSLQVKNQMAELRQNTVFYQHNGLLRPLSSTDTANVIIKRRNVQATYDWARNQASWSGDVKAERRGPIALRAGDMDALLINLAIMRDARPGAQMHYRFADVGRLRMHQYQAAASTEIVPVCELSYDALRVWRSNASAGDAMVLWIANGVPTPVRITQQEDGKDTIDLRLIQYQGE